MPERKVDISHYAMTPRNDVPRSAFDTKYSFLLNFNGGALVPFYVTEILPGDALRVSVDIFARMATMVVPPLDDIYLDTFYFFVPNRILWNHWERFMGQQEGPADTTAFLVPYITIDSTVALAAPDIYNCMGLVNPVAGQTYQVNALPFRAYNRIWNEWFRDQDLDAEVANNEGDGPDAVADYSLLIRRRRPDYFTTSRPWPQKPSQSALTPSNPVLLPGVDMGTVSLGGTPGLSAGAPVTGIGVTALGAAAGPVNMIESGNRTVNWPDKYYSDAGHDIRLRAQSNDYPDVRVLISDIRTANQVQLFMERNARGGSRYAELVRAHFGVVSPDARLQRPEYLGGGHGNVLVSPVAQTSETSGANYLGEQAGIGTATANNHGFSATFTEHGFVLGLVNVRTPMAYEKGIHRMWFRRTVFDHYFPAWAHLAEQPVLRREIWADGNAADETTIWGYQERWAEYKTRYSITRGQFAGTGALNIWHFTPYFAAAPALNSTFMADDPPLDRVLQVPAYGAEVLFNALIKERWVRCMPMYSIPGLGGRF